MSDEEKTTNESIAEPVLADEHTTVPNTADDNVTVEAPKKPRKWEMPEPVFQQTSGYLPQGFVKQFEASQATAEQDSPAVADGISTEPNTDNSGAAPSNNISDAPNSPDANIEPQPHLSEDFAVDDLVTDSSSSTAKSASMSAPYIFFGVIAILLFAAAFAALIYYMFFFWSSPVNGN